MRVLFFLISLSGLLVGCQSPDVSGSCDDPSRASSPSCGDSLTQLREQLAATYQQAINASTGARRQALRNEQQLWNTEPVRCESRQPIECQQHAYLKRIAQLNIQYGLIDSSAEAIFTCGEGGAMQYRAKFYQTALPAMTLSQGGQWHYLYQVRAASGSRYEGNSTVFWEHQGEATISLPVAAQPFVCQRVKK